MNRLFLTILFFTIAIFAGPRPAQAEDAVVKGEKAAEKQENPPVLAEPDMDKYQEKSEKVYDLLKEISEGLSPAEQKHFYLIYNNYNLLGTVRMVQEDVGKAIDACSTANPDMEGDLRGRYKEWSEATNPVVDEAQAHIDNMVAAQEYAKPKKIKALFAAIDKTRKFTNKQIEKTPVTTPDACEYLLGKMDDTQKNLKRLLKETLISVPPEPEAEPEEPAQEE